MSSQRKWVLRFSILLIAVAMPFYFMSFGDEPTFDDNGGPLTKPAAAIVVFSPRKEIEERPIPPPPKGFTIEPGPFDDLPRFTKAIGIWARPSYDRDTAAAFGLLTPFLLIVGLIFTAMPNSKSGK